MFWILEGCWRAGCVRSVSESWPWSSVVSFSGFLSVLFWYLASQQSRINRWYVRQVSLLSVKSADVHKTSGNNTGLKDGQCYKSVSICLKTLESRTGMEMICKGTTLLGTELPRQHSWYVSTFVLIRTFHLQLCKYINNNDIQYWWVLIADNFNFHILTQDHVFFLMLRKI